MQASQSTEEDPLLPAPYRVVERVRELDDVTTLHLEPRTGKRTCVNPGQFNMLYAFGIGEVAISISAAGETERGLFHTIRDVGKVSHALSHMKEGAEVGLRGPFGSGWPIDGADGRDIVIVAGGVGLAPLRPAIEAVLAKREQYGRVTILLGFRSPKDILFPQPIHDWREQHDVELHVTVDHADADWRGHVGVVPTLIQRTNFDAKNCLAFVCGPEIMMRFSAQALLGEGVSPARIHLSMERNMKCAVGHCGRCQFGPHFVCKDGPVFPLERITSILSVREV
ncbi:FAD/NAD(P)-binding protein [Pontixanthobacter gangjinensis]|uniref:Ni/Fe hydrogenase subunit gamma n=1 Tax=Pontixanthobacter gangjinensis TaxID=1028742 RepID=A0A6I4SND0_9SPHN|nr:FAD/NAD(P)-binding protein [Pontixanthobacter gangjinensis]MXO57295.1 Ni/Fe hydrogenase subunit gamma [Pontixanthobacter gangjinensis]